MRTQNYTASVGRRTVNFHNTNRLLGGDGVEVMAGKTGFISKAGYCLATLLRLPDRQPRRRRRPRRALESRPLLRNQTPGELDVAEGRRSVQAAGSEQQQQSKLQLQQLPDVRSHLEVWKLQFGSWRLEVRS